MEELAKSMEESAKKENCYDDEVDHIHGRNWRGPRGARAKRFYIRDTKPDTSAKKGVRVLVVDVIGALCLCCCWCARAARNPLSGVVGVGLLFLLLLLLLMFLVFAVDVVAGL